MTWDAVLVVVIVAALGVTALRLLLRRSPVVAECSSCGDDFDLWEQQVAGPRWVNPLTWALAESVDEVRDLKAAGDE